MEQKKRNERARGIERTEENRREKESKQKKMLAQTL